MAAKLPDDFDYKRIIVVGKTSSGKITYTKKQSEN